MKRLFSIFVVIIVTSCSFDNKTGIWKDASNLPVDNQTSESIIDNSSDTKYENIFIKNKIYNEEKKPVNPSNIELGNPIKISNWPEQYALPNNNVSNFSYSGNRILLSKSSRLNNFSSSNLILLPINSFKLFLICV